MARLDPAGRVSLRWRAEWVRQGREQPDDWAHHGVAGLPDGRVVIASPGGQQIEICDRQGRLTAEFEVPATQVHGITVAVEPAGVVLWLADSGEHRRRQPDGTITPRLDRPADGAVLKVDLTGEVREHWHTPAEVYGPGERFAPTHITVDPESGGERIWVCDGYGSSRVLCLDRRGEIRYVIEGSAELGRLNQPHGAWVDRRRGSGELLVTDRANSRIQVFDLDGGFLRGIGPGPMRSPGHFTGVGEDLLVAELHKRVFALGADDSLSIALDGQHGGPGEFDEPWPHAAVGATVARPDLAPGAINSPHSIAMLDRDTVILAEWILGGRISVLDVVRGDAS